MSVSVPRPHVVRRSLGDVIEDFALKLAVAFVAGLVLAGYFLR